MIRPRKMWRARVKELKGSILTPPRLSASGEGYIPWVGQEAEALRNSTEAVM